MEGKKEKEVGWLENSHWQNLREFLCVPGWSRWPTQFDQWQEVDGESKSTNINIITEIIIRKYMMLVFIDLQKFY